MSRNIIGGYELDEVDSVASLIAQLLQDERVEGKLAILALCRVITMTGSDYELDMACSWIDDFSELIEDEKYDEEDVEEGEEDESGTE